MTPLKQFIIKILPLSKYTVIGDSMLPTYKENDVVIMSKLGYIFSSPKIGDIVVAHVKNNKTILKRIAKIDGKRYYVVGDNFRKSTDSRIFGWIHKKDILGKAIHNR